MPEPRYPTLEEFWERLEARNVEPDLRRQLRERLKREQNRVSRVGERDTVVSIAARLLPGDVPPEALAAFLDEAFDKQLGRGDEQVGLLPRDELIPAGFQALDEEARSRHGRSFPELADAQQDELLQAAEEGKLKGPGGFDSSAWFKRTRGLLLLAFGSDPRGMVQMGFPGPSYMPGHIWLDGGEVQARADRKPGYLIL
jgi:hypothetical protein